VFLPFKGQGHEIITGLKWYGMIGLGVGESPADIQKLFNCPFNFIKN
jgi:hypothetical protein